MCGSDRDIQLAETSLKECPVLLGRKALNDKALNDIYSMYSLQLYLLTYPCAITYYNMLE